MAENSKIEWCDHTASPWYGCSHKQMESGSDHPGCTNCYAEVMAKRNPSTLGVWGAGGTRVISKSFAANCRRWNAAAAKTGARRRVFPSICDPFEDYTGRLHYSEKDEDSGKPVNTVAWWRNDIGVCRAGQTTISYSRGERLAKMDDARQDLFRVIDECPWLDFLLLTKRPENIERFWVDTHCDWCGEQSCAPHRSGVLDRQFRDNVWLGTSVSDQETADELLHHLRRCWYLCPVLFVSYEPALGPVSNGGHCPDCDDHADFSGRCQCVDKGQIRQWIYGGESGPKSRRSDIDWGRQVMRGCRRDGTAFFAKQLGSHAVEWSVYADGLGGITGGGGDQRLHLADPKGGDMDEWPEDLRVREFPRMEAAHA